MTAELGWSRSDGPHGEFTTDGSPLWVRATGFEHGGFLDSSQPSTGVHFGPTPKPPTDDFDQLLKATVQEVSVAENETARIELPPGRYWVMDDKDTKVTIESCIAAGITDATRSIPDPLPGGAPRATR